MTSAVEPFIDDLPGAPRQPVILQVLPRLVTGGVERGTVEIAAALVEAGWTALVASAGGPMVRELERLGVEHIGLPLHSKNPLVMYANARRLEALLRERGVDLVHARSRAPAWSALIAARRARRHFVTTFHGTYNLGGMGLKRRYNAVMARGERVIAISDFIALHVQREYGTPPERIRVIHRGVDLARFDPARVGPDRLVELARKWRIPDGRPLIMLPGRLTRWKGQAVLIEAMALLGRRDLCCLIVGSDQGRTAYRDELEELVRRRDLEEVVRIVGDCADMPAAYKLADVVVSASTDPEAFGRVAVEAQAMGRPVIASDHGGARETVLPGVTGWLTRPGDAVALAAALGSALAVNGYQRERMSGAAMEFVRRNFSTEAMCARTLQVYTDVLASPPPGAAEVEAV